MQPRLMSPLLRAADAPRAHSEVGRPELTLTPNLTLTLTQTLTQALALALALGLSQPKPYA